MYGIILSTLFCPTVYFFISRYFCVPWDPASKDIPRLYLWKPTPTLPLFLTLLNLWYFLSASMAIFLVYDVCCRLAVCEYGNNCSKANGSFSKYCSNSVDDRYYFCVDRFYVIINAEAFCQDFSSCLVEYESAPNLAFICRRTV